VSRTPKAKEKFVLAKEDQRIQVRGTDLYAVKSMDCEECVACDDDALCNAIHDEVDMCGRSIWITEINNLKRKMRDD
jgi:hypothetical protein